MDVNKFSEEIKEFRLGKDVSVFLVCLLIASVFWLLNALTKFYSTVVEIPITYVNIPSDRILSNVLPQSTSAELKGSGFRLLSVTFLNAPEPIVIDYNLGNMKSWELREVSSFGPEVIRNQVMEDIPSELTLGTISLDSLKMMVEEKVSKQVPVAIDLNLEMEYPYFLNGTISADPEFITIEGAGSKLDQIDSIYTNPLVLSQANKRMDKDLNLAMPDGIESESKMVRISIPIDQYTEGKMEVPIAIKNFENDRNLVLFPATVEVTYLVGLSEFENVKEEDFLFEVDANTIKTGKMTLLISNSTTPSFFQIQDFKPHKVEYIIKK